MTITMLTKHFSDSSSMEVFAEGAKSPYSYAGYRRVILARSMTVTGKLMWMVTSSWLVYRLTNRAGSVGILVMASNAPSLVAGPVGGYLIDRVNLRRLAIIVRGAMALPVAAMAALTAAGKITPLALYVLSALAAIGAAISMPLTSKLLTAAVPDEMSSRAITSASIPYELAGLVGSLAGGVVVTAFGPARAFGLNAALMVIAAITIAALPGYVWGRATTDRTEAGAPVTDIRDGLKIVPVRLVLLTSAIFLLLVAPLERLAPTIASEHGESANAVGVLLAAASVGAIVANPLLRKMMDRGASAVRLMGIGVIAGGVVLVVCGAMGSYWVDLTTYAFLGAAWEYSATSGQVILQRETPAQMNGRMTALYFTIGTASLALGGLALGLLMDALGLRPAIAIAGALAIGVGIHHVARTWRSTRVEARNM